MAYTRAIFAAFALAVVPAFAQQTALPQPGSTSSAPSGADPAVLPVWKIPSLPIPGCSGSTTASSSLHDRTCYEAKRLLGTGVLLRGFAQSGFSEWMGNRHDFAPGHDEFTNHLAYFYTRRAANSFGEWAAGALNHEPIQPDASGKSGFWNRSRAAFLSVLVVRDDDNWRPALAPAAGSLASGFVTMGCCGIHRDVNDAIRRSSFAYAGYFATALFREFKPDLKTYAKRKFHQ
jgi:hypothetical protein